MKRLISLSILIASGAIAGPVGYVINFSGQFGTMDLVTGLFTPLGPGVASNSAGGLAGAAGGPFYGVDANGHLLRFSTTGAITDVGDTGTGVNQGSGGISVLGGLTNGSVYALDFSNRLYLVDQTTAVLTLLGALGLPAQDPTYDLGNMTTSLNGDGSFLYYTLQINSGPNATGPTLFRINPTTLAVSSVALSGLSGRIIGSGFVGGALYGFTETNAIVRINTTTGAAVTVGNYDAGVPPDGGPPFSGVFGVVATATPEPGTLWLSMLGVAAAALRIRRR